MQDCLLELAKRSTEEVERSGWKYYYQAGEYKFNNVYLANWYEREHNCWASYIAQQIPYAKDLLKNRYDHSVDYTLEYLKKLRNENNYLQLFFSGGVDSLLVLETAINNDIFIDELIVVATGDKLRGLENKEIYTSAIPIAKRYEGKYGKLTIHQTETNLYKSLYKDPYSLFKLPESGAIYPIFRRMWNNFSCNGTKIFGPEKPQLLHYNNKWYNVLVDSSLNGYYAVSPDSKYFNYDAENVFGLIKDSINYRKYLYTHGLVKPGYLNFYKPKSKSENLALERPVLSKENKLYDKIITTGPGIWNYKDQYALIDVIKSQDLELLCSFYKSVDNVLKVYPDYKFKGINLNPMKIGWFIDIDDFKIYTQTELIPNGFINEMD